MKNQHGTNHRVIISMVPTHWQENRKKSQLTLLRSSLSCFLEMSLQISCIYLGDRVTASNLKSFMMDLAVMVAEFQRASCVLYRKQLISPVSRPAMEQGTTHLCIIRDKTSISKILFYNMHKFILFEDPSNVTACGLYIFSQARIQTGFTGFRPSVRFPNQRQVF